MNQQVSPKPERRERPISSTESRGMYYEVPKDLHALEKVCETCYRSIGAFLACVFASTTVHLDMHIVDDLKEVFDYCNSLEFR
jgi:hypothetical protein